MAMDLKSMLNESTVARPPPTSPQNFHRPAPNQIYAAYQGNVPSTPEHPASQRQRPSQPPPLQTPDFCPSSTGYGSAQSPSQHTLPSSTSTHSAESQSAVGFGAGPRDLAVARDGAPYNSLYPTSFVPSPPSVASHQTNQGPPQQYQQLQQRQPSGFPTGVSTSNLGVLRESPVPLNGPLHPSTRQFSPQASQPPLHGIPLGPPATFQKPSPQATQRTSSQGLDHVRTHSVGSPGSQYGYDYHDRAMSHYQHPQPPSRESSVRQYSFDREREKSMSVSPKTIPQPSPLRHTHLEGSQPQMTSPPPKPPLPASADHALSASSGEAPIEILSSSASATPKDLDRGFSPHQSPRAPTYNSTPSSNSAMPPVRSSPAAQRQPALKRNASVLSVSSSSPQPPHKRSKRTEVPIYARSARPNKPPLKFTMTESVRPAAHVPPSVNGLAPLNGNVNRAQPVQTTPVAAALPVQPSDWEPSIMGSTPYEELTRYICDMIFNTIGNADPPTGGAVFEIEAKLGEIYDVEEGRRIRLPVMTETVFDKNKFGPPTRFESSMNVVSIPCLI